MEKKLKMWKVYAWRTETQKTGYDNSSGELKTVEISEHYIY